MAAKSPHAVNVQKFKRLMSGTFKWVSPWDVWFVKKIKGKKIVVVVSCSPEFLKISSLWPLKILSMTLCCPASTAYCEILRFLCSLTFLLEGIMVHCTVTHVKWWDHQITNNFLELQIFSLVNSVSFRRLTWTVHYLLNIKYHFKLS